MENRRNLDIELIRIIACFFVIFNHTGENGFFLFSLQNRGSVPFWMDLMISIFCKCSVPLFFAITGALLLDREESAGRLWRHRIGRIGAVLLFWSFVYYLDEVRLGWRSFQIGEFVARFFYGDWNLSFWYLYAYIPLLMTLPLLRKFVKSLTDREFCYLFFLAFVFLSLLPALQYLLWQENHGFNENFRIDWLCSSIFVYPCLGYFLYSRTDAFWNGKRLALLWLANLAGMAAAGALTCWQASITGLLDENHSQTFFNTFVLINCAAVFGTCRYGMRRISLPEAAGRLVRSAGSCTLGIYLLHMLFLKRIGATMALGEVFRRLLGPDSMTGALLYCAAVFLLGWAVTLVLKRIPLLRRLV